MQDAPNPDPYEAVLADLRAQREKIDQAIVLLETLRGRPAAAVSPVVEMPQPQSSAGEMGPGEFLGMTIVDAAKKLLNRERRAMGNAEILAALDRGGLVLNSADPLNVVSSVLTRRFGQVGDVVRVARGTWGLKEWYPNRSFRPSSTKDLVAAQPAVGASGLEARVAEAEEARVKFSAVAEKHTEAKEDFDPDEF